MGNTNSMGGIGSVGGDYPEKEKTNTKKKYYNIGLRSSNPTNKNKEVD